MGCSGCEIAFSWHGLPQYAARLIKAGIDRIGRPCVVIGSPPSVPVDGMERVLGQAVHWVDARVATTWADLGLPVPRIFVQSGWSYPAFSSLGREVKAAGGRVIGLSDANWRGDVRQIVFGPIAFRLRHSAHFDAMLVPGRQGERLMTYFGMPRERIRHGMLAADHTIFSAGPALPSRPREFLFVGQFIARKDVLGLQRAFLQFSADHPDWTLRLVGSGPQRDQLAEHPNLVVEPFIQPENLARRFHAARFFVLPSRKEAWGLVVHEAALCGCALVLSDAIGSADDLASPQNAIRFRAGEPASLVKALATAAASSDTWLARAEAESLALSAHLSPQRFADAVASLIAEFGTRDQPAARHEATVRSSRNG